MKKNEAAKGKKKPFFARYLETQDLEGVRGGGGAVTLKYPSDQEDGGGGPVTLKYPSDKEDTGGGDPVTLKYPSDGDDDLPAE